MKIIIEQLLNGLTIGSFYSLIAMGYSMVYGVMKLINFAHGDLFTFGSYLGYTLLVLGTAHITSTLGVWGGMIAAMLLAAIGTGILGLLVERIAYRPIYPAGRLPAVVSALGASIFIQNAIMVIWGARPHAYTSEVIPGHIMNIAGFRINILQIIILLLSFSLMGILYYIVQKTTFGAAIRASALDRETAALMGININLIIFLFLLSVCFRWDGRCNGRNVLSQD